MQLKLLDFVAKLHMMAVQVERQGCIESSAWVQEVNLTTRCQACCLHITHAWCGELMQSLPNK